jgi:hypothetical protein
MEDRVNKESMYGAKNVSDLQKEGCIRQRELLNGEFLLKVDEDCPLTDMENGCIGKMQKKSQDVVEFGCVIGIMPNIGYKSLLTMK